nr:MAG TPA: hypothetical protein [Caudoviricetes sp.]
MLTVSKPETTAPSSRRSFICPFSNGERDESGSGPLRSRRRRSAY